jgi:2'-5' RNA ligase superfamily
VETTYILTAEMDGESFAWLDSLRREHFPPERNFLSAHLTLFHRLSAAQVAQLRSLEMPRGPVMLHFDRVALLGFGVSLHVQSAELERLRNELRVGMGGEFSRQDSQSWKPHVTLQKKVPVERARELHGLLQEGFRDRAGASTGLLIWRYLGGPWELSERMVFGGL